MPRVAASPAAPRPVANTRGASLIEVLVALLLVVIVTAGVAHLLVWARRTAWSSGTRSIAVTLAIQKLELLRSLRWDHDDSGTPRSDTTTDLSLEPPAASGTGLQPSPVGTLTTNTPGFVDYVGVDGRWRGTGARPAAGAAFVRRWSVEVFAADGPDTLILTVVVLPLVDAPSSSEGARGVRLSTIRTRARR
jgi:hypothetical protein